MQGFIVEIWYAEIDDQFFIARFEHDVFVAYEHEYQNYLYPHLMGWDRNDMNAHGLHYMCDYY